MEDELKNLQDKIMDLENKLSIPTTATTMNGTSNPNTF
jgi:hypothetical protein